MFFKTISNQIFIFFKDQDITCSLAIPLLDTQSNFFLFKNIFLISIFTHCLSFYHWEWLVRKSSFKCSLGYLSLLIWPPEPFYLHTVQSQISQPLLVTNPYICGSLLDLLHYAQGFFVLSTLALNPALQMCLTSAQKKGRVTLPDLPGISFLMQSRLLLVFSVARVHCWAWSPCLSPVLQSSFPVGQTVRLHRLFLPRWGTWYFPFENSIL